MFANRHHIWANYQREQPFHAMGIENDTRHREHREFNENRESRKKPSN